MSEATVKKLSIDAYDMAQRFVGMKEMAGKAANPAILAMLHLDTKWPEGDETPWCSAFVNYVAWLLRLPRSKSLRARSWLTVGVPTYSPTKGFDVVILRRGSGDQPGPEVIDAPGHVGFFSAEMGDRIYILGGNQSNTVNVSVYDKERVLGFRRLRT